MSNITYNTHTHYVNVTSGSFHVKSTNLKKSSSMAISDFLHFAVYERHIIQEQNKKKIELNITIRA